MIHKVSSSLPSFKTLTFRPGLNVILADKSDGATDRQTRNSSGKTSLVTIVHFLMGASCPSSSIFRYHSLLEQSFSLNFDLSNQRMTARRSGSDPNKVFVDANLSEWPEQPTIDSTTGESWFSNKKWTAALALSMFDGHATSKYSPSFRSMFPYFARVEPEGGFQHAEKYYSTQQPWNIQVNLSHLLGLDWKSSQTLQELKDQEKTLKLLKRDSSKGVLGNLVGKAGELRTKLALAEKDLKRLEKELSEFQVLPEYRDLEKEASTIAIRQSRIANANTLDRQRIKSIEQQLQTEQPVKVDDVVTMYEEAYVVLPDLVRKRIEDVQAFHDRVIKNRLLHLEREIQTAEQRIFAREEEALSLDKRRREIMKALSSHGAIDQMIRLEEERSRLFSLVDELKKRLEVTNKLESTKTELTIERARVKQQISIDHSEHEEVLREAILTFEELSREISDHEGSLEVDVSDNGPTFKIKVEGGRSVGIRNMQIFCFDMMLSIIWAKRHLGPGFLIHDSHLYDGMDSRQVAKAIEIGEAKSQEYEFQYIITMNSDQVPRAEFKSDFSFDNFVNPVQLSDKSETGGLFGMRI
ncbi:DUF2326 domain-containing protein [bacterium]|nr:DUF2326 domain-containing protein [bacterium]